MVVVLGFTELVIDDLTGFVDIVRFHLPTRAMLRLHMPHIVPSCIRVQALLQTLEQATVLCHSWTPATIALGVGQVSGKQAAITHLLGPYVVLTILLKESALILFTFGVASVLHDHLIICWLTAILHRIDDVLLSLSVEMSGVPDSIVPVPFRTLTCQILLALQKLVHPLIVFGGVFVVKSIDDHPTLHTSWHAVDSFRVLVVVFVRLLTTMLQILLIDRTR